MIGAGFVIIVFGGGTALVNIKAFNSTKFNSRNS
jgi:hypothetical protein